MRKKSFYIAEENEKILNELQAKLGFTTSSQVINYLLSKENEAW